MCIEIAWFRFIWVPYYYQFMGHCDRYYNSGFFEALAFGSQRSPYVHHAVYSASFVDDIDHAMT